MMKKIIVILFVVSLLMTSGCDTDVGALDRVRQQPGNELDEIFINDCQVLDEEGETYILNSNINSDESTCINIQRDNITLDCEGHAIIKNSHGHGGTGILVRNSAGDFLEDIEIKNCILSNWGSGIK